MKQTTKNTKQVKTILIHSADKDLAKSLSILLQNQHGIVVTETAEELALQRENKCISILVVDLERSIPALLEEFELRHWALNNAPIIVLYAFRQGKPDWEERIRALAAQILYKPVQLEQILSAISTEKKLVTEKESEADRRKPTHLSASWNRR